jgi:hypothetical protein
MRSKGYVKTIEEENYTLRCRVDDLDVKLSHAHQTIEEIIHDILVSAEFSMADFMLDNAHEMLSTSTDEDNAFISIIYSIDEYIRSENDGDGFSSTHFWKKRTRTILQKKFQNKLLPKWTITYWVNNRIMKSVSIVLKKRKKYFFSIYFSISSQANKFASPDDPIYKKYEECLHKNCKYFKKLLYNHINTTYLKSFFTPYK